MRLDFLRACRNQVELGDIETISTLDIDGHVAICSSLIMKTTKVFNSEGKQIGIVFPSVDGEKWFAIPGLKARKPRGSFASFPFESEAKAEAHLRIIDVRKSELVVFC